MPILFVDESDIQSSRFGGKAGFVLTGLLVNNWEYHRLNKHLDKFRGDYLGGNNLKFLRDATAKTAFPFEFRKKWSVYLYKTLFDESFELKAISCVLGRTSVGLDDRYANYIQAFSFIIERLNLNIFDEDPLALIVADATAFDTKAQKDLRKIISDGQNWKGDFKERIFPTVIFDDDDNHNCLQLADLLCKGVQAAVHDVGEKFEYNYIKGNEDELVNHNYYLKCYWDLFVKSPNGSVSGWGIKVWD